MTHLSVFDSDDIRRVCTRISHEIIERNHGSQNLVLIGLLRRGALFASRLANQIEKIEGNSIDVYSLDITSARDDKEKRLHDGSHMTVDDSLPNDLSIFPPLLNDQSDIDFTNTRIVVVDDVLFTGRSVRAALDVISNKSRPQSVQLAVLIDRGHRELPIRADYVGKNLPTKRDGEQVLVLMQELDQVDRIDIERETLP